MPENDLGCRFRVPGATLGTFSSIPLRACAHVGKQAVPLYPAPESQMRHPDFPGAAARPPRSPASSSTSSTAVSPAATCPRSPGITGCRSGSSRGIWRRGANAAVFAQKRLASARYGAVRCQTPGAGAMGLGGGLQLECYVLDDGRRVFAKRGMARALGLKSEGGNAFLKTLSGKKLGSEITEDLKEKLENPIVFTISGADPGHGFEGETLDSQWSFFFQETPHKH